MAINNMIKIGITGQQGFVGKHLYNELKKHSNEFLLLEFQRDFFQNESKLDAYVDKCDVIIHLAAMNRHESQQVIYDTNINLVQKLMKSLEATNSKLTLSFLHLPKKIIIIYTVIQKRKVENYSGVGLKKQEIYLLL